MSRPPFNLELINALTPQTWALGHRLLQTHRYGENEAEHVRFLLEQLAASQDALVVDMGSGFGELVRQMRELRPDLNWVLVNLSGEQNIRALELLEPLGGKIAFLQCDAHKVPCIPSGEADAVMFNSSLVQMDELVALREAHRILRPGGRLLVNELTRDERITDGREMEERLACRCLTPGELMAAVETSGFDIERALSPDASLEHFTALLEQDGLRHLADGLAPMLITAVRGVG